mgnify:CR=1 FL=1
MPRQVADIREFLQQARLKDAQFVKIKKSSASTKFKLRFATQLYTLVVADKKKAAKVKKSLPNTLKVVDISTHRKVAQ